MLAGWRWQTAGVHLRAVSHDWVQSQCMARHDWVRSIALRAMTGSVSTVWHAMAERTCQVSAGLHGGWSNGGDGGRED